MCHDYAFYKKETWDTVLDPILDKKTNLTIRKLSESSSLRCERKPNVLGIIQCFLRNDKNLMVRLTEFLQLLKNGLLEDFHHLKYPSLHVVFSNWDGEKKIADLLCQFRKSMDIIIDHVRGFPGWLRFFELFKSLLLDDTVKNLKIQEESKITDIITNLLEFTPSILEFIINVKNETESSKRVFYRHTVHPRYSNSTIEITCCTE